MPSLVVVSSTCKDLSLFLLNIKESLAGLEIIAATIVVIVQQFLKAETLEGI